MDVPEGIRDQNRKIASRFMVRGHWRNQAHGPGRSERKLVYITPHYRGPDMAQEVLNKPYIVGMRM
ncbi:MAG: hypothetical protein ING19_06770 [Azospirillum sp.]|nr:hypothetical protein [Azospirillum sp.]